MADGLEVRIGAREIYDRIGDVDSKVTRLVDQHTDLRDDLMELKAESRAGIEKVRTDSRAEIEKVRNELAEKGRRNLTIAGLLIPAASGALSWYANASGKG